ncbi:MAG: 16S rRNA (uracil(1498)-N(3))-methyltransferase [Nitrospirae bacterium]|nr:16S rRNA (uracil(1498)-N(3))-methyltransferase [Nitrospirota bacterium]
MPYIFVDAFVVKDGHAQLDRKLSHYVISVLRHRRGDDLQLFDTEGRYYRAVITAVASGGVTVRAIEETAPQSESALEMVLCQGLLKGDKMDMVVEKSTELGVKKIIPLLTQRGQLHYTRKLDRWKKIAIEASRQSGRVFVPEITQVTDVPSLLSLIGSDVSQNAWASSSRMLGLMFYEGEAKGLHRLPSVGWSPTKVYVLIGTEGGFTKEEVGMAESAGVIITSLGRRILRAETASIAAITLVQFLFGDLG